MFLYKKPSFKPSIKSFLTFNHILVLVAVKAYSECDCSKLFANKMGQYEFHSKATSCLHYFGTA